MVGEQGCHKGCLTMQTHRSGRKRDGSSKLPGLSWGPDVFWWKSCVKMKAWTWREPLQFPGGHLLFGFWDVAHTLNLLTDHTVWTVWWDTNTVSKRCKFSAPIQHFWCELEHSLEKHSSSHRVLKTLQLSVRCYTWRTNRHDAQQRSCISSASSLSSWCCSVFSVQLRWPASFQVPTLFVPYASANYKSNY